MTRDEAIAKKETNWWKDASPKEIVDFQLYEPLLCMPFELFAAAMEEVLGRPVFTHEFGWPIILQHEYEESQEPLV